VPPLIEISVSAIPTKNSIKGGSFFQKPVCHFTYNMNIYMFKV